jgi:hypothetical protein
MAGDFEGNPFASEEGINPFADPAVTQVTEPPPSSGPDDYNPFAEGGKPAKKEEPELPRLPPPPTKSDIKAKNKAAKAAKPKKVEPPPAVVQAKDDKPPAYSSGAGPFADQEQSELEKREAEIAQRERDLQAREKNLERLGPISRENNFPPFPAFCPSPFKPCFYININVEVPPPERWKMWALLGLMIFTWVMLVLNVFVSIVGAAVAKNKNVYLTTMGVSILYLVLFVPGTLFCWFLPVYHAYRKDSSLAYMWFFFVMLFQVLSYILNGIGAPNLGACGFFNGVKLFGPDEDQKAAGAMFIIMGLLWHLAVPLAILLMFLVHRYYRQSGGSLNRATEEAVSGAAKNKAVRGAVKSGVNAGVKASM